ncbi:MAG: helix-turn-helix domain-containing protein [Amphritea sp.]
MSNSYSIGQLSQLADCKITTIRWYEKEGLLPAASRNSGNQRRYTDQHLMTLRFIRHARALGFDLAAVRQLQQLCSCCFDDHQEADRIAREHLLEVRAKIKRLQAMEEELARMVDSCQYDQSHQCRVLEVLADHTLCEDDHHH